MQRIVFMGTPNLARVILSALIGHYEVAAVVTQPDADSGRGRKPHPSPVKALALEHWIPVLQPLKVRQPDVVEQLRELHPDAIVVAAFGQILPATILSLPPYGCINVHGSLLPHYRGAAPIPAAILAGDLQTGITIMQMDAGMDTGPILAQRALPVSPDDTSATLTDKMAALGADLLLKTLPAWFAGQITPQKQDDSLATYCQMLEREHGRIDWSRSAGRIEREIRAYQPWPGSFTNWGDRQLTILRAHVTAAATPSQAPGAVIAHGTEFAVVTGEGLLVLDEVQLASKRPLPIAEFARGQRGFSGAILGQGPVLTEASPCKK
ncbi:MAG TPA: methionyl-tRNA formyltransferase [Anaerolineae bacterium]|nr:methionyl-tRNA formyltransferase [Anaerolineae bacterium]